MSTKQVYDSHPEEDSESSKINSKMLVQFV